jgi:hypothetical protein
MYLFWRSHEMPIIFLHTINNINFTIDTICSLRGISQGFIYVSVPYISRIMGLNFVFWIPYHYLKLLVQALLKIYLVPYRTSKILIDSTI